MEGGDSERRRPEGADTKSATGGGGSESDSRLRIVTVHKKCTVFLCPSKK